MHLFLSTEMEIVLKMVEFVFGKISSSFLPYLMLSHTLALAYLVEFKDKCRDLYGAKCEIFVVLLFQSVVKAALGGTVGGGSIRHRHEGNRR